MACTSNFSWGSERVERCLDVCLENYEHDIQFYKIEVLGTLNLDDLEKLGIERWNVLRTVGEIADSHEELSAEVCLERLVSKLREKGMGSFARLFDGGYRYVDQEERRWVRWRDHVSYVLTSLAFGVKDETKRWLRRVESKLMDWRLTTLDDDEITAFMEINDIRYPMINVDEKAEVKNELIAVTNAPKKYDQTIFYKVPFVEAAELLKGHRIHVKLGYGYLTTSQMRAVISDRYEHHTDMELESMTRRIESLTDDSRVFDLINDLKKKHSCAEAAIGLTAGSIVSKDLDEIAVTSFPPCMRKLHDALRRNHRLTHWGRRQYVLYLKTMGMPVAMTIELFRKEFTKRMTEHDFQKEYPYYIKHWYGLVGSNIQYKLDNCARISESEVRPDDYHGCPFAIGDIEDLTKMLTRWNIKSAAKSKVVRLTIDKKYGEACSACFQATHGCSTSRAIVNPINYYRESKKVHDDRRNGISRMGFRDVFEDDDEETGQSDTSDT